MKKPVTLLLFSSICFCLLGFKSGEQPAPRIFSALAAPEAAAPGAPALAAPSTPAAPTAEAIAGANISQAHKSGSETWAPEELFGDWSGVTKGDGIYSGSSPDCILSINSDNTWACYVNGEWLGGTWEIDPEKEETLALTAEYGKKYPTPHWYFGDTRKGMRFYTDEGAYSAMEYGMRKMDEAREDELCGDWYGEAPSPDRESTFAAYVSVNSDGTWSSSTHFAGHSGNPYGRSTAEGDIKFESEDGNLVLLGESEGGIVKKVNGRLCFGTYAYSKYYGDEPVEVRIDASAEANGEIETEDGTEEANGETETEDGTEEANGTVAPKSQTQVFVGDWIGESSEEEGGGLRRGAVLSVNADHTWVSCAAGEWHAGSWEAHPEDAGRILLTTQAERIEPAGEWYFEIGPDGCIYAEEDEIGLRRFQMEKMEDESPDQLVHNWYGEKHYPAPDRFDRSEDEEVSRAAFVSIDDDRAFTLVIGEPGDNSEGIVSGSAISGKIRYISESGHVLFLGKNRGGIIKRPDGKIRFETYLFVNKYGRGPYTFWVSPYQNSDAATSPGAGTGQNTVTAASPGGGTGQNPDAGSGESWRTEDFFGDWSGNVLLSINSDNTWAANHGRRWYMGVWKTVPGQSNRINLYSGDSTETDSYLEKSPKGVILHLPKEDSDPGIFYMSKMKSEPPEELFGNWHGEVELSEFDLAYNLHLSIDPDNTWTSVLSEKGPYIESDLEGVGVAGRIKYISEGGHLAVFDPYNGGITKESHSVIQYESSVNLDHWGSTPLYFSLEPDPQRR